jgi:hypothetical protein
VEVRPGRGLDLGAVELAGQPLSWLSPIPAGLGPPTSPDRAWIDGFSGGLLVTCGLRNIGPPTGDEPMHGDYTFLPATGVRWDTTVHPRGASATVEGTVESLRIFGSSFQVRRRILVESTGDGDVVEVTDTVRNVGVEPAALAMLYHLNLGAPLVVPGTRVSLTPASTVLREPCPAVDDWTTLPPPAASTTEAVFEHRGVPGDDAGLAHAEVSSPTHHAAISWTASTLPRLYQWVLPTQSRWALGIEPSTAPLFGEDRDDEHHGAPRMEPGQARTQTVRVALTARS